MIEYVSKRKERIKNFSLFKMYQNRRNESKESGIKTLIIEEKEPVKENNKVRLASGLEFSVGYVVDVLNYIRETKHEDFVDWGNIGNQKSIYYQLKKIHSEKYKSRYKKYTKKNKESTSTSIRSKIYNDFIRIAQNIKSRLTQKEVDKYFDIINEALKGAPFDYPRGISTNSKREIRKKCVRIIVVGRMRNLQANVILDKIKEANIPIDVVTDYGVILYEFDKYKELFVETYKLYEKTGDV